MNRLTRLAGFPYIIAIVAVAVAGFIRWLFDPWLGSQAPYAVFFIAIVLAGLSGGWRPAAVAAVLGFFIALFLFAPPHPPIVYVADPFVIGILFYLATTTVIVAAIGVMHASRRRAQAQKELWRTTLASIGDAVMTTDAAGDITFLNPVAERLTGWRRAEAVGRPLVQVLRLVDEQTRQPLENPVARVLLSGEVTVLANRSVLIAKGGAECLIEDSAAPIRDAHGIVAGVVMTFRDVSERRQAEIARREAQQQIISTLESIPDMFVRMDRDWRLVYVNSEYEKRLGRTRDSQIGRVLWEEWPELRGTRVEIEYRKAMAGRQLVEFEYYFAPWDRWYALKVCPVASGDLAIFIQDISDRKRAEAALRISEERFRLAAEAVNGIIYDYDLKTGKVERTQGLFEVLGYRPDEASPTAEWWWEHMHPDDRQKLETQCLPGTPLATGRGLHVYRMRRKDGHYVHLADRSITVQDATGRVVRQVGCSMDVTVQIDTERELRDSERREQERAGELEAVLRAAPAAIWISHDPACEVVMGNPAAYRLLEMPEGQNTSASALRDRGFCEYRNGVPIPSEELPMQLAAARGIDVEGFEMTLIFSDGHARAVYGNAAPLRGPDGKVRGSIAAFMDITALKDAEQRLKEDDRRKDEFLATLAHELRNPLAPISNAMQLLKRKAAPESAPNWELGVIERQIQIMARLLDDLLDVSRISRNKLVLRKERVELADVIRQAVETSRPLIDIGGHALTLALPPEPVELDADPVRLAQIFSNLLTNAAKYTPGGGHIRLAAAREDGRVMISISDDGIGISADMLPRLFEIFSQAEPALQRSQGGLGIGLSLVRGLVELHGGTIEAHSEGPGRGSEFTVRLPALAVQAACGAPAAVNHAPRRKKSPCKVLIADDNRDGADSMSMMLESMGHDVCTAYDGNEALAIAARERPEVMILDIGMPHKNGYEVCRHIRNQPWGGDVVMIALTGWGQSEDRQRARAAGFNHHLVKPVDMEQLTAILASVQVEQD